MQRSTINAGRSAVEIAASDSKHVKDCLYPWTYQDLLNRKEEIQERLRSVAVELIKTKQPAGNAAGINRSRSRNRSTKACKNSRSKTDELENLNQVPVIEKSADVHWDFTLKEMMWLATDFQAERKRQISLARKIAAGIKQFHKTREARRVKELAEAELKRRRLAGRIGREVRCWWTTIERVIAYKQKCSADEERRKAMNRQLVALVKQTEKYAESLIEIPDEDVKDGSRSSGSEEDSCHDTKRQRKKKKRSRRSVVTIEEALLLGERSRRAKNIVVDYNRLHLKEGDDHLYGESTASDMGSDGSYLPPSSDEWTDDETTLVEAEALETSERLLEKNRNGLDLNTTFTADAKELLVLREERNMPIEHVLERYWTEEAEVTPECHTKKAKIEQLNGAVAADQQETNETEVANEKLPRNQTEVKRVAFAPSPQEAANPSEAHGKDAKPRETDDDDDADSSDMEDLVDSMTVNNGEKDDGGDYGFEEFEVAHDEVDDETSSAQEKSLPQEMPAKEEIDVLTGETVMSDELRNLYAGVPEGSTTHINRQENSTLRNPTETQQATTYQKELVLTSAGWEGDSGEKPPLDSSNDYGSEKEETSQDNPAELVDNDLAVLQLSLKATDEEGEEEEYVPPACDDVDDETTLEREEKLGRDITYEDELALLRNDNQIPVSQLCAIYASVFEGSISSDQDSGGDNDVERINKRPKVGELTLAEALQEREQPCGNCDDGEEFDPLSADDVDDETTMEAEERLAGDMSYEDEIALLNKENEMSIEELRAKYTGTIITESRDSSKGTKSDSKNSLRELASATSQCNEDDSKFITDADELDDETTLKAEERHGQEMPPKELGVLQPDGDMRIERLYEMYQNMEAEQADSDAGNGGEGESEKSTDERSKRNRKRMSDAENCDFKLKRPKVEESDEGLAAIEALEKGAERARKTLASRPFLLASWVKLRAYQQTGLNWLVSLQTRRLNGILADEMGLGKTLQTISLLAYLSSYKGIWGPHLVVVPTSVIVNWEAELKRFCPGMKALCYYGSAKRRKELRSGWTKTSWYHVVVTSYQLAVQDAFAFKRKRWYYLILDEAQNIKNFQSQRWQTLINFNAQRRLLLTGTPLQNNLMELWSLLHFLMPYIFRSRKEFSFWFSNPMDNMLEGRANQNVEMIARLHGIIRPFVLRRLKKDVETQLPGKFEHLVKCPLSRRQMFFYEEFISRSSTRQALKKGGNYIGMMNVLMQLRKVCNHPELFEPRSVVTPFVLNPVKLTTPECVIGVKAAQDILADLSEHLISPLWCGSTASPSIESSSNHDKIRSMALIELEDRHIKGRVARLKSDDAFQLPIDIPPALAKLLLAMNETGTSDRKATIEFQREINSIRCRTPTFPCPLRLLQAVQVARHPFGKLDEDFLSTPSQLLAMRWSQQRRAEEVDDMIKKFVFCIPKAGAPRPILEVRTRQDDSKSIGEVLLKPAEEYLRPFRKAQARLTSFFPDKKLIQFDGGKLQVLADLLHKLKRGGHRVLIFTQMSKMLDILEAFLNLNGHTYVRLDGSTVVERRQRLMDRFNNDTKIFSFILSTRSGGMGINLTGADTVIFYDSDWNPAMDAQAQDRAHRIGQTREVHIYRLITAHSIEENILAKAQQKRNLDILVMDKGKFDGSTIGKGYRNEELEEKAEASPSEVYTKGGLRAILGCESESGDEDTEEHKEEQEENRGENMTREQMEAAMTTLEDQDDVVALRGAQNEAAEELLEFDESIELNKDSDNEVDDENADNIADAGVKVKLDRTAEPPRQTKREEDELEKEFAAWQDKVGIDASALEASLSPTETYALNFRQKTDPFYSVFAVMEERRRFEASKEMEGEIDVDQIEREQAMEEQRAIDVGDLLATRPRPEDLVRQRNLYLREKARLKANKKRRTLTGENWELREDGRSKALFWYNTDTGEALWDKPRILVDLEAEETARENLWTRLQLKLLVEIMSFLVPFPERKACTSVCRQWRLAANDISFIRHVYPIEMSAFANNEKHVAHNHYRTIAEALSVALPGDTIEFGDGHYWVNDPGLIIDFPLKLVGDEHNASNVVIEISGTISWNAKAGLIEGITFRRPKISYGDGCKDGMLRIMNGGRVDLVQSVIDNTGSSSSSAAVVVGRGSCGCWVGVIISGGNDQGLILDYGAKIELKKCVIRASRGNGINGSLSQIRCEDTRIMDNGGFGVAIRGGSARFLRCHFERNEKGILLHEDGCKLSCSQNTAPTESLSRQNVAGFRAANESKVTDRWCEVAKVRAPSKMEIDR